MPDLTVILDLPPEIGLARAAQRRAGATADRFEIETIEFHTNLRLAFRRIATAEPQRCVLVNADQPVDKVGDEIWAAVNARLDPSHAPLSLEDVDA